MPQLLILAAVAVGGYYAFKFVKREIGRVGSELEKTRRAGGPKPRQTLEQDPESGRYKPRDKG
ncbi:MAG: hypothetical protein ACTSSQ_06745 [Alphaproteobacteria bacterium]